MHAQQQNIKNDKNLKFSSTKKYLKIFVPDFAFKHDNDDKKGKDKFVGREVQFRRLYTWLTSESKSGSYLITGYRGMGKSLLVRRVIEVISREPRAYKEIVFFVAIAAFFFACYIATVHCVCYMPLVIGLGLLSMCCVLLLCFSNKYNYYLFEKDRRKLSNYHLYDKEFVSKYFVKRKDRRERDYNVIPITINLGQEILHERDVLSLMAQNIYDKYGKYVKNNQSRPFYGFVKIGVICILSCVLACRVYIPVCKDVVSSLLIGFGHHGGSYLGDLSKGILLWVRKLFCLREELFLLLLFAASFWLTFRIFKAVRKYIPYFSVPYNALERLSLLCERIKSNTSKHLRRKGGRYAGARYVRQGNVRGHNHAGTGVNTGAERHQLAGTQLLQGHHGILTTTDGKARKRVLEYLLKSKELDDTKIYRRVKTKSALVGTYS